MDKQQKGTDHKLSLEPNEFRHLVSQIRQLESETSPINGSNDVEILRFLSKFLNNHELNNVALALAPVSSKKVLDCEIPCRLKLGKSLVYGSNLKAGTTLGEEMICAKVTEPFGISAERFDNYIGRTLCNDVNAENSLCDAHFEHSELHE